MQTAIYLYIRTLPVDVLCYILYVTSTVFSFNVFVKF